MNKDSRFNGPGLMVMSKYPVISAKYTDFFPDKRMFLRRGYLEVEIENIGLVVCTHLSADFKTYYEFDTPYTSYLEQQSAEINKLSSNFGNTDHILLGDLNTGPTVHHSSGLVKGVYE